MNLSLQNKRFDAEVWGPHYWFFLQTVAYSYPEHPNSIIKRKYYDLIQNMPLFIPDDDMGDKFSKMLEQYPVTPYLDCRDSFIRWVHFIHNKYNILLEKEEVSLFVGIDKYFSNYLPKPIKINKNIHLRKKYIILGISLILLFGIIFLLGR